jgi:hypothetical protein
MTDADRRSPEPNDIARQRAADADREAVAERLRVAAGEGRIELWELDERLGQAYGAKTYGELAALLADLPVASPFPGVGAEPDTLVLRTTTPNIRQEGRWIVLILPDGWAARVGPLSTYTGHISNKATEIPDPGAPTVIVTGHPLFGYIKIRQRRRRR